MITVKVFKNDGHKEVYHFHTIHKFAAWLNLYYKSFSCFEVMDSKKTGGKLVFYSKLNFEDYYKTLKKA